MGNTSIDAHAKWGLFVLGLALVHFVVATSLLKIVGVVNPGVLIIGGGLWVWVLMPEINAWLVKNTPFGKIWEWARKGI